MKAIGIVLAGGSNERRLGDLTSTRATSALAVGSCYRAIDFSLSNMSASRIGKVAVITQSNSRSLHDHLQSSKWWNFGRKQGGLFVFTPYTSRDNNYWFRGTADSIYQNITYLKRSNEKYVVIASGDGIYKMNYRDVIQYHIDKEADITLVYKKLENKDLTKFGIMDMNEDGRLVDFEEKPFEPQTNNVSLGIYVIERELLISLLEEILQEGRHDFVKDIVIRYRKKLKMFGYEFTGYWSNIGAGIMEYYDTNMDFLKKEIRDLFTKEIPYVQTKPKDEPPVKFNLGADVSDAVAGCGSIINGKVQHSVLFRKVFTGENSIVKDSVVMERTYVGNDVIVENAIIDKDVHISDGKSVIGMPGKPIIVKKGTII